MKRVVAISFALLIALAIGGALYLAFSLDAIVARAIEREGTRVVGAPVRVGAVDIELSEGIGTIRELEVGNPEGFENAEALRLEQIVLQIAPSSLRERPVRVARIEIAETSVHLEIDEQGRSNLDQIVRHAKQAPARAPDEEPGEPTRIAIDRLRFEGGGILLDRPGAEETARFDLPGFDRENIGGSAGATGGEIAKVVAETLARQVAVSAAASQARSAVEKQVDGALGGTAGEAADSLVRGLFGE